MRRQDRPPPCASTAASLVGVDKVMVRAKLRTECGGIDLRVVRLDSYTFRAGPVPRFCPPC